MLSKCARCKNCWKCDRANYTVKLPCGFYKLDSYIKNTARRCGYGQKNTKKEVVK